MEHIGRLGVSDRKDAGAVSAAAEMILEGLWAHRRIGRSEERGYFAEKPRQPSRAKLQIALPAANTTDGLSETL